MGDRDVRLVAEVSRILFHGSRAHPVPHMIDKSLELRTTTVSKSQKKEPPVQTMETVSGLMMRRLCANTGLRKKRLEMLPKRQQ
jgi:hypothetical protein